jgi:hypothetical protein
LWEAFCCQYEALKVLQEIELNFCGDTATDHITLLCAYVRGVIILMTFDHPMPTIFTQLLGAKKQQVSGS